MISFILFIWISGAQNQQVARFETLQQCREERDVLQREMDDRGFFVAHIAICTGEVK